MGVLELAPQRPRLHGSAVGFGHGPAVLLGHGWRGGYGRCPLGLRQAFAAGAGAAFNRGG